MEVLPPSLAESEGLGRVGVWRGAVGGVAKGPPEGAHRRRKGPVTDATPGATALSGRVSLLDTKLPARLC